MRRTLLLFALLLSAPPAAFGQETDFRDELLFVDSLRNRGDAELAKEYLQKLAKIAPPEIQKELPYEFAKLDLRIASKEPETAKRLALYNEARDNFRKFIQNNPGHPRLAEANLDVARVLNFVGKTELNRAYLTEDKKEKNDQATQARQTLEQAYQQLEAAEKELIKRLGALPDGEGEKDAKKKKELMAARTNLENQISENKLDRGLNLYDQARTFVMVDNNEKASELFVKAKNDFGSLAKGDTKNPITWKAQAWFGRATVETESAAKALEQLAIVLASNSPVAVEAVRVARFFRLEVIANPTYAMPMEKGKGGQTKENLLITAGRQWRQDYRNFLNTPEGHGLTYLLANALLAQSKAPKLANAEALQKEARGLLREVELSENEYTERARRLKIRTMSDLGLFKVDPKKLKSFEDLYVRTQYETIQLQTDQKEAKDPKDAEAKRKARIETILQLLSTAMATPEAKKTKDSIELNNARAQYTYWSFSSGKIEEAIRVGEDFARNDPRSSQAETSAVYTLQAYSQLLADKQSKMAADLPKIRERLFSFAAYLEDRWPKSLPGEMARHVVSIHLLREGEFGEAILKLSLITPGYGSYPHVCALIADICERAEKASADPIVGDQKGDFRKRLLIALESIPEAALGNDPFINQTLFNCKAKLARELFRYKRFNQMKDLSAQYLAKIDKFKFSDEDDKDKAIRAQLRFELVDADLFARYGLADAAFQAGDFAEVIKLTTPLVNAVSGDADSQEKQNMQKNQQLSSVILTLTLRSNTQLGNIEGTNKVLDVMDKVAGNEGGDGGIGTLKLLATLIRQQVDEIRKKGDKEALTKAITGYSAILKKRVDKVKPSEDVTRVVAECFSAMGDHTSAAKQLRTLKAPAVKPKEKSPEEQAWQRTQLQLVRELRLSKTPADLKEARQMMDTIMGDAKTPGWGRRNPLALKENGQLLHAEEKYTEAAAVFADLVKQFSKDPAASVQKKEFFLESNFHMIAAYTRIGMAKPGKDEREKYLRPIGNRIAELAKSWGDDFGSEASKKRFTEFLANEPIVKGYFDLAMQAKK